MKWCHTITFDAMPFIYFGSLFLFITCILLCVLFSYLFLFSHSGHSLEKLPKSLILASKTGWNLAIFSAKIQSFEQNNHSKDETFSGDF